MKTPLICGEVAASNVAASSSDSSEERGGNNGGGPGSTMLSVMARECRMCNNTKPRMCGLVIGPLYYLHMNETTYVDVDEEQVKQAMKETDEPIEVIWNTLRTRRSTKSTIFF